MKLKEMLSGIIPEKIKPPIKPVTFSNLYEILEREKCASVVLSPMINLSDKRDPGAYIHGIYSYHITWESQTSKGRKIKFEETVHEWERIIKDVEDMWQETQTFPLTKENNEYRTFLSSLARRHQLQEMVPSIQTFIKSGNEIMDEDWIKETRRIALGRNLIPWDARS